MKRIPGRNCKSTPRVQYLRPKHAEVRGQELAHAGIRQSMGRREFFKAGVGMTAAFLGMDSVYGSSINVAEAADIEATYERALSRPLIIDARPRAKGDNNLKANMRLGDSVLTVFEGPPFDGDYWKFLNDPVIAKAAGLVKTAARLAHYAVNPGQQGWMEDVDYALAERQSLGGWSLPVQGEAAFRLDDEKLMYPFYEKTVNAGINIIGVPKGPFPRDYRSSGSSRWKFQTPRDLVKAASDWPQLNFVIYHSCFRPLLDKPAEALADFESTGRVEWCSDLAEVPALNGATNIYGEIGTPFASTILTNPRLTAAMLGVLINGLGASNVLWGSGRWVDSGALWQIIAFRRFEILEAMQKDYGFAPLGHADGPVKNQILGLNAARLYGLV